MPINHSDVENFHVKLNRRALGELLMEVGLYKKLISSLLGFVHQAIKQVV